MAQRRLYFPGKDVPWLETKLNIALEESALGVVLTNWVEGDTNAGKQLTNSPDERIRRLSHDLSVLDPGGYPVESVTPITRTKPNFSGVSF
jgi:hypothetical protein